MAALPARSSKLRLDPFLLGLVGAVALAFVAPEPGATGGWLQPQLLNKLGVALIFFLHGLTLSFAALKQGTLNVRLHVLVQASTFLLFPMLGWLLLAASADLFRDDLRTGVFYLCALPSTVSSSVALTATARGNVPVAVFNATLSSLLGVFVTPLWLSLMVGATGQALPLAKVIIDLVCWLILPLALGQLARPLLGELAQRYKSRIGMIDRATILLLVYTSFCDSVKADTWSSHGLRAVALTLGASMLLLACVMGALSLLTRLMQLPIADRIAVVFCGSKKTLASGVPMAGLLFAGHSALSLILLPIMIYHPLQLVVCGYMAGRWSRRADS